MEFSFLRFIYLVLAIGLQSVVAQNSNMNLTEALGANNDTSTLSSILKSQPGLANRLSNAKNVTLLAPSNQAISNILNHTNTSLSDIDPSMIQAVLMYHVLNGTYHADNITNTSSFIATELKDKAYTNLTNGQVVEAVKEGGNVTFMSALKQPSNVTQADIAFKGGVIHVIDKVLSIPENVTATVVDANLTAIAGAFNQTNLTSTLDGKTNITAFVPRNAAFQDIASVLQNASSDDLRNILDYHIVENMVAYSTDLKNGTLKTVNGKDVNITVSGNDTYVNAAKVLVPDVLVSNGVVHVIDNVLNPNGTESEDTPNTKSAAPAFSGASSISGSGIPFTSGVPTPTATPTAIASAESHTGAGARPTAAVAMGALFGGAAVLMNDL